MTAETPGRGGHREAAIAHVRHLLELFRQEPDQTHVAELIALAEHLERAVTTFHMEAIRFRMYSLDRALKTANLPNAVSDTFGDIRRELEAAGFATRSHA
jgi:hypothetical protein